MNGEVCRAATEFSHARLRRLPVRLRLAHLAALLRCEAEGSPRIGEFGRLIASMTGGRAE